jgi:hypothetical protein
MKQTFYSNKSALNIEHSKNGLFVEVAPLLKVEEDIKYYDWENKKIVLLSVDEALVMAESIQIYIHRGAEAFHSFCQTIFRNPKYKNLVFVHDKSKRGGEKTITSFGFQEYNGYFQFTIDIRTDKNNEKLSVPLDYPGLIRLKEFLKFIAIQEMART